MKGFEQSFSKRKLTLSAILKCSKSTGAWPQCRECANGIVGRGPDYCSLRVPWWTWWKGELFECRYYDIWIQIWYTYTVLSCIINFKVERIRVRINPPHPLVHRKRQLKRVVFRMRLEKPSPCLAVWQMLRHDTDPSLLNGSEHRPKFCCPSMVMVMSPWHAYNYIREKFYSGHKTINIFHFWHRLICFDNNGLHYNH
jgi:hypothetical protein